MCLVFIKISAIVIKFQGHGKSEGPRAYAVSMEHVIPFLYQHKSYFHHFLEEFVLTVCDKQEFGEEKFVFAIDEDLMTDIWIFYPNDKVEQDILRHCGFLKSCYPGVPMFIYGQSSFIFYKPLSRINLITVCPWRKFQQDIQQWFKAPSDLISNQLRSLDGRNVGGQFGDQEPCILQGNGARGNLYDCTFSGVLHIFCPRDIVKVKYTTRDPWFFQTQPRLPQWDCSLERWHAGKGNTPHPPKKFFFRT